MNQYYTKEIINKDLWEGFLLVQKPGTFLQSWNWGDVNKKIGYKIKRFGFYQENELLGIALCVHQPAKRGPHILIPGGPVINYENSKLVRYVFFELKRYAKDEGVWFVRIRSDIEDKPEIWRLFKNVGMNPAPMHVHGENTLILDIGRSEEEVLAGMRKNTRYLIKKSLKEDYSVTSGLNGERIENLYKLQKETVKRHKFIGFKKRLFKAELDIFGKDDQALCFECKKGNDLLASAIIIFYAGKAFYHFSGSSNISRETNASYYLQWQIIKEAQKRNIKYYDFWGIAAKENPKHRFWGVTVFKRGFGGERKDWMHAHDLPTHPFYWITYFFETLRRGIRHL